jgi:hypothetical protein
MCPLKTADEIFNELKATPKQIEIDGVTYYVVEGDLYLDETELLAYSTRQAALAAAKNSGLDPQREGLVGIADDSGRIVRWRKGLVLTYTVVKDTFSDAQYTTVVKAMHQATAAWEATCGVNFKHLSALDDGSPAGIEKPVFRVLGYNSGGKYIAVAFFPYHLPARRVVAIDPSFFADDLGFNPVGVLRHELGHVLGFRHEHIRSGAPAVCPGESLANTIALTDYNPTSVMHYFCGGVGSKELEVTEVDRQGARSVYGPPDQEVTYCE